MMPYCLTCHQKVLMVEPITKRHTKKNRVLYIGKCSSCGKGVSLIRQEKHKCPPHHFIIDNDMVGHCIYCSAVRDFGKLQEKEGLLYKAPSRKGAVASISKPRHRNRGRRPKWE